MRLIICVDIANEVYPIFLVNSSFSTRSFFPLNRADEIAHQPTKHIQNIAARSLGSVTLHPDNIAKVIPQVNNTPQRIKFLVLFIFTMIKI